MSLGVPDLKQPELFKLSMAPALRGIYRRIHKCIRTIELLEELVSKRRRLISQLHFKPLAFLKLRATARRSDSFS